MLKAPAERNAVPRRTKAAVADSQQDLRLIESSSAPAGELKGRVASFELTSPALALTWDLELSEQPTAPPKDRRQSPHLSGRDLWSERASLYKPGRTISAALLGSNVSESWAVIKKDTDKSSQFYCW